MSIDLREAMYDTQPEVAELNSVKGFDPRKFMRRAVSEETKQEVYYLDLKFKKLWFRLAHPAGRIKTTVLKITNQLAIVEAKVYFKNGQEPVSSFVAQRTVHDKAGPLYIEAAQYAAVDQALCDAGFGLQFCDVSQGSDPELYDSGVPAPAVAAPIPGQLHQPVADANPPETAEELVHEDNPPVAPALEPEHQPPTLGEEAAGQTPAGIAVIPVAAPVVSEAAPDQAPQPPVQEEDAPEYHEELISGGEARYTPEMTVDEIYALMTPEEAAAVISDVGNMAGQTLEAIAQRRPAVLKWYINGCNSGSNILRAGARIMLEQVMGQKLAS